MHVTLRILNGTLLFDEGELAISDDCCPVIDCEDCCTDFDLPAEVIVDLGAGGLTDTGACVGALDCTDIAGEFTIPRLAPDALCTYKDQLNWCGGGVVLEILVEFFNDECGECLWRVTVALIGFGGGSVWETTAKEFVENDCTLAAAVTVNEISQSQSLCGGSLPAAITIEAAP